MASKIYQALKRRKRNDQSEGSTELSRCLNLFDLTALGVGATLGLGVYVLAGSVAKTTSGPAVCLSFLAAAVASAVAGLCYAEFAARVPRAGSAYVYSYVGVGEFVAFVIGWNLLLEYVIGTASVARGLSNYIDALADKKIRDTLTEWMPMDVEFLSSYPDFFSFIFVMLFTALLAFGVKESSNLNNLFTVLNLATICIVLVAGAIKGKLHTSDISNWKILPESIPEEYQSAAGKGGFLPFGVSGVMAGAAKCFYGFVGFDSVATTGEEAKNPQRDIPLAIVFSLFITFLAYFGISTILTMIWPYYLQDPDAPLPYVFEQIGWHTIKWIVTVGAIFALLTSLLGAMFPLPRVVYAMSSDGLIFKFLAKVSPRTKTPLLATVLSGLLSGIMAVLFNLDQLIDMMSIGTLLAYTIVAVSVLIMRYQVDETKASYPDITMTKIEETVEESIYHKFKFIFNLNNNKYPSVETSGVVTWSISLYSIFTVLFCVVFINGKDLLSEPFFVLALVIAAIAMLTTLVVIGRQPTVDEKLTFKVPLVPLIPCLSVLFNVYLMLELDLHTWIRFSIWLFLGFLIYFFYGIKHSEENLDNKKEDGPISYSEAVDKQDTKF
ncbi:unnamed protein product [Acanthoscelides obtectus]|uniref:Cationic amino acid transporter C-terminal domain-containing protein n=1 Tax=Acanthoscelides obtectus TaxID=200917 RepID=A0A9P0LZY6_ACAOB|nr:unnamed protein product [Acanthoscelides obtectus]CAK1622335.1 High affinity cationic amino acid transporter 1 [Acanthoscelides obtectus]